MTEAAVRAIRRLPQVVADAIAAGEVVERPASVVKELCENALDAGATRVEIDAESGGLVRIRVSDDGVGIAAADLALTTARHATSKIGVIDDLAAVATLGFRGEALASIAAVAEVEITSATAGGAGSRRLVRGGEVVSEGAAARTQGTTVEVRDLFFNTPARLRFMKSERAEAAAITRMVADLALTRPGVAFTCRVDDRTTVRTPGSGILRAAAAAVFGGSAEHELIEVDGGEGPVRVRGCIAQPRAHRGSRSSLVLVVNGRRVHNRSLLVAVDDAYRGLIPAGRHPYGVVVAELDASAIDVNVHPTKREVRFRNESEVFVAVERACGAALLDAATYQGGLSWSGETRLTVLAGTATASPDASHSTLDFADARDGVTAPPGMASAKSSPRIVDEGASGETDLTRLADLQGLRPLGQSGTEWIVAAAPGRVVLVDPHAAHEKILYERILARWDRRALDPRGGDQTQLLLIPALVECTPAQMEAFASAQEWLVACGFDVDAFGATTLRCAAVPASSSNADVSRLLTEILDGMSDGGESRARRHRMAALIACHSAVRFGDALSESAQLQLLTDLAITPNALTCPHGRPTVMVLDNEMLRRAFGRPRA